MALLEHRDDVRITQKTAQSKSTPSAAPTKTALQELEEYLRKSPAQRMREAILKKMGLTEEALNAMPPKERAAVENTIAKKVKEFLLAQNTSHPQSGQPSSSLMTLLG